MGGCQSESKWPGVQAGPEGYFPLANSSASQVWGYFLPNASGLPYSVGGEGEMSYLGRSGSAEAEGQTELGGGRGRAGGALSFPFSWRAGLVLPVRAGRDPLGECVACCGTLGRWGGKEASAAHGRREVMSPRNAWSGARFDGGGEWSRLAI